MAKVSRKMKIYPPVVYIYACDWCDNGEPILAVVHSMDEIPEDEKGSIVATYELTHQHKLVVTKTLE
jgi:hypothetical protein